MKFVFVPVFMFLNAIMVSGFCFAHEGHDHDAPTVIEAPKGGVVKSLEKSHVEVVGRGKNVAIYLYDGEMKPVDPSGFKVVAKAELPRKKGADNVALSQKGNALEGTFDAKGAHRYTLKLTITDPKVGHEDKLNFTIEPKK